MAVNRRLSGLLARERVEYELMPHAVAFTAQDVARTAHIRGRRLAKVVVARAGRGEYLMAVIPAAAHVDLDLLAGISGHAHLELATERELLHAFPDCQPGAMPPFGDLYHMPTYLDACLALEESIYFQAGNHEELVHLPFHEYARLAGPFASVTCLHQEVAVA